MMRRMMNLLLPTLLLSVVAPNNGIIAFQIPSQSVAPRRQQQPLFSSSGIQPLPNEFSRTYRVDRILGGGPRQRDYNIEVEAKEDELRNLANRFDLKDIYSLQADLALRRERMMEGKTPGVEVEGTITGRVTQMCVRTGEVFDVDVEFPLYCIVRPLLSFMDGGQLEEEEIPPEVLEYEQKENNNKRIKKRKGDRRLNQDGGGVKTTQALQQMDIMEIQKLLQDIDVEDDVMEDEAIYSSDGTLDVGELVAQMFWLKLDPYPRKPGTNFVQTTISG